jgi:hypothetical protein
MTSQKKVAGLSSRELYDLANEKAEEERAGERTLMRKRVRALRVERRELVAAHKKALADVDKRIRELAGGGNPRAGGRSSGDAARVMEILQDAGTPLGTKAIRSELTKRGAAVTNLNQTLAYLKRRGRVTAPSRAVYALP